MDREEIIRVAREAGFEQNSLGMTYTSGALHELLERFAALVAEHERNACVKVCEALRDEDGYEAWNTECAAAIRARANHAA